MQQQPYISAFIFSAFDTGIVIDTAALSTEEYLRYAGLTLAVLQRTYPHALWGQEDALSLQGSDDADDFLPIFTLSYVKAICPKVLSKRMLTITTASGTTCTVTVADPVIYFHTFSAGTISLEVSLSWDKPYTQADLHSINHHLLEELAPLVEPQLPEIIEKFVLSVKESKCPLYIPPFIDLLPATFSRKLLYWSHFIYLLQVNSDEDILAAPHWIEHLMQPIDDQKVHNMALKPHRYIYLGWGRSMICCTTSLPRKTVHSYVHMLEARNYLWKTLYDLDRGLRDALVEKRKLRTNREARKLSYSLHELDFRIRDLLENIETFKVTFDHEKIWLAKQFDSNWLTADLITSLQSRVQSFRDFYDYSEEITRGQQQDRLQGILNLIAIFATAGAITEVINFFDPLNKLMFLLRIGIFGLSVLVVICVYIAVVVSFQNRRSQD